MREMSISVHPKKATALCLESNNSTLELGENRRVETDRTKVCAKQRARETARTGIIEGDEGRVPAQDLTPPAPHSLRAFDVGYLAAVIVFCFVHWLDLAGGCAVGVGFCPW